MELFSIVLLCAAIGAAISTIIVFILWLIAPIVGERKAKKDARSRCE